MPCPKPIKPTRERRYGISIELHLIGIKGLGLDQLRLQSAPDVILMAGLAGALDPALRVADVLIEGLPFGWTRPAGSRDGTIHTATQLISTPAEKAGLFAQTNASAVEMENARVGAWAARQGWNEEREVRVIAIRAISDRADQILDPAVMRLVDSWGRLRIGSLLRTLARRPWLVPALLRLGSDSAKAAAELGLAVQSLAREFARQSSRSLSAGARDPV